MPGEGGRRPREPESYLYRECPVCLPDVHDRFGLTNQMRRAAVSIPSNLAEGCSRSSKADSARFVEIATGSVFEVVCQATISRKSGISESN